MHFAAMRRSGSATASIVAAASVLSSLVQGAYGQTPWDQRTPSPKYAPPTCHDLFINLNASATTLIFPTLGNLSAPGAVDKLLASVEKVVAVNKTQKTGGEFYISGRYCEPSKGKTVPHPNAIQLLIHGATYTKDYWAGGGYKGFDGARYSYIQYAADQGYATLSLDTLGNGKSSHLNPGNITQAPLQEEVTLQIIQQLKAGKIVNKTFGKVVYVGHSYGSILGAKLVADHPTAVDALVLTGYSNDMTNNPSLIETWGPAPAKNVEPRLHNLDQGYLAIANESGRTTSFYYDGRYEPELAHFDFKHEGTLSVGEAIGLSSAPAPAYKGPVYVVTGDHDEVFCGSKTPGICLPAQDSPPAKTGSYFKGASSFDYFLAHESGHDLNFHYSAPDSYAHIHDWIGKKLSG